MQDQQDHPATSPAHDDYVFVLRPRCPGCNSVELRIYKSISQDDGSVLRYVFCRECGRRFKVIAE